MLAASRRWARALRRVMSVERRSPVLSAQRQPRQFTHTTRKAWSGDAGRQALAAQPDDEGPSSTMMAPVRSTAVLIGKFDVDREVRLRFFYPELALCARFQKGGARNGVTRTVAAWKAIGPHYPDLMPRVRDHGTWGWGGPAFLVEEMRAGRYARASDMGKIAGPIAARLHRVHRAVGIESRPLSAVTHPRFRQRWADFAATHHLDAATVAAVDRLVRRDALLQVSIGHGDLVGSNILLDGSDLALIDWEYTASRPIVFDLAKMHATAAKPTIAAARMQEALVPDGRSDHYSFTEQLALAHVQFLTWHRSRQQRAARAGREEKLATATERRLRLITDLLA